MADKTRAGIPACGNPQAPASQHPESRERSAMILSVSKLELAKPLESPPQPVVEASLTELVIKPRRGWIPVDWKELWTHRELPYFLAWRDVKVRYKQAILGVAWAVLAPLLSVLVFTLIFGARGLKVNGSLPQGLED